MESYKEDILLTRKGCLGGSDAKMLDSIATIGYVPKSAYKRMAVCKGIIAHENNIHTKEMAFGDFVEQNVYEHLYATDNRWQSNPCLVSKMYSRPNVKCIDHVDLLLQDDENRTLIVGEVKATKDTFENTRYTYKAQLAHHYLMARELAKEIGGKKPYGVKVYLCHYDTNGLDLTEEFTFDIRRLTIHTLRFFSNTYKLSEAMDIVNKFLEDFNEYYTGDEIDSAYLPAMVQAEFDAVTKALEEIKQREKVVNDFKAKLYKFMSEKGIKGITNAKWSITRVDDSVSVSFDSKRFLEDYEKEFPRKAKKLRMKYEKRTKRQGYALVKLKNNNNND